MNHVWLTPQIKLMTDGLNFPQMVISSILLTEVDKEKSFVDDYKNKVLSFIQTNKRAYINEISDSFKITTFQTRLILNLLEHEGKISIKQ